MDKIIINELEVFYCIGVPEEERAKPQRLLLTLEMEQDFSKAAHRDDLTKTVDYSAVCEHLKTFGDGRSWRLIETLAVNIADFVLKEFKPHSVSLEIKKFIIPQAKWVGVKIQR